MQTKREQNKAAILMREPWQEMNMVSMDREARHLRKYLYQRRVKTGKFDNVIEELGTGWDPESLKNWLLLGNMMTIMVSDVIQIFLSTQENIKVSLGLVEALMTYCSFFCKG